MKEVVEDSIKDDAPTGQHANTNIVAFIAINWEMEWWHVDSSNLIRMIDTIGMIITTKTGKMEITSISTNQRAMERKRI